MARIDNAERARIFGPPCTPANHRTYLTPWGIRVPVHFLVLARFAAACDLAKRASSWVPQRIDGYNCRTIRGSSAYSTHAWALSWDFFVTPPNVPPPGGVWTPDDGVPADFAAAFERYGFCWGANFARKDVPHIEWDEGRPAPITPQEVSRMFDNHRFVRIDGDAFRFFSWSPDDSSVYAWNGAPGPVLSAEGQNKARCAGGIRHLAWVPGVGLSAVVGNPGENSTWAVWNFRDLGAADRAG